MDNHHGPGGLAPIIADLVIPLVPAPFIPKKIKGHFRNRLIGGSYHI